MTTVSELLKKARLEKEITFQEVERETKIKAVFIKALEEGQYQKLPAYTYARGFLKNYAQYLGLDIQVVLALFRREFDQKKEEKLLPPGLAKIPTHRVRISFLALVFSLLFISFLTYFLFQYKGFLSAPSLTLSSPSQNQEIQEKTVVVSGKTDSQATLLVNSQPVLVRESGDFEEEIPVVTGDFQITVIAKNRFGRESQITRMIKVNN